MSIPKEMIILIGALVIAAAVPAVDLSSINTASIEASPSNTASPPSMAAASIGAASSSVVAPPQQRTSHLMRRSAGAGETKANRVEGSAGERQAGSAGERQAFVAFSDTLRHAVRAGEVLIIDLPEELHGTSVGSYSLLRAPALSWLVDYSFMWRTLPQDAGSHHVMIRADAPAALDTLVLAIVVQ